MIQDQIRACKRCPLYKYLGIDCYPVPGHGNPNASIMFIAEAPGEQEELFGKPLVGPAGQLFDKMLGAAGIDREQCYCSNIVHCRPTKDNKGFSNRAPTDEEIAKCKLWIWKEMQWINPSTIVTMGKVATYTLLNKQLKKTFSMGKACGQHFRVDYHNAVIIPVFHPSFLMQHGKRYIESTITIFRSLHEL